MTESQIHEHFGYIDDNPRALQLRKALCALVQDVLFIHLGEGYVPRISAQKTYIYETLSSAEKDAFNRIYEEFYYYRHNEFWGAEALKKLPALVEATQMLCCAEDLGMVPACVGPVMNQLRILSLEIQAMPKEYGLRFGRLENNPYTSVVRKMSRDANNTSTRCCRRMVVHQWKCPAGYAKRLWRVICSLHPCFVLFLCKTGCLWTNRCVAKISRTSVSTILLMPITIGVTACI